MKCPKCKGSDLATCSVSKAYECHGCGGIWMRKDDISSLGEAMIKGAEDGSCVRNENDSWTGVCPDGHGIMIRARIEDAVPFYLERCSACGGVWFDKGEWQRIAGRHFLNNLAEFWSYSWQRRQRQEKSRQAYLRNNEELLGKDMFNSLLALAGLLKTHKEKGLAMAFLQEEVNRKETPA